MALQGSRRTPRDLRFHLTAGGKCGSEPISFPAMTLFATVSSPIGDLTIAAELSGLTHVLFEQWQHGATSPGVWRRAEDDPLSEAARVLSLAESQLTAYFAGTLHAFDLPLAPRGTPFQQRVWSALRDIPFGVTVSYGELARRIGEPRAVRAAGGANARNPLAVVVPCHRVIGSDGSLTGFGGGMDRKQWLLEHEGALPLAARRLAEQPAFF